MKDIKTILTMADLSQAKKIVAWEKWKWNQLPATYRKDHIEEIQDKLDKIIKGGGQVITVKQKPKAKYNAVPASHYSNLKPIEKYYAAIANYFRDPEYYLQWKMWKKADGSWQK